MQLIAGGNIQLSEQEVEILIKTSFSSALELDVTAYLLDANTQKVRGDHDMIFYGQTQTPNQSIVLTESNSKMPYVTKLKINTARIDEQIQKIALCVTLNEPNQLSQVQPIEIEVHGANQKIAFAQVNGFVAQRFEMQSAPN